MKKNPVSIPHTVWYADDIRRGEREAADVLGLTLYELMLRAGEAARLLGCSVAEIESDRLHCAQRLVQRYGGVAVLKGAGTVVAAHPDALGIIDAGNAGMASGGMGDVLSGIIGALLGQKLSPYDAACAGCVAHGAAADVLAARFGTRGMLATDLFSTLQRIVNPEVTDKNHDESSNSAP